MSISNRVRTAAPLVATALKLQRGKQPDIEGATIETLAVVIAHFIESYTAWRDDVHVYLLRSPSGYDVRNVDFVLDLFNGEDPRFCLWHENGCGILELTGDFHWDVAHAPGPRSSRP